MIEPKGISSSVQNLLRAIPERLPGKQRLVRIALRAVRSQGPIFVRDRYGNCLRCPSIEEPIAAAIVSGGAYEPDTVAAVLVRLKPKGTFVDVGANIGATALPVAALCPNARVICVEADPEIAAILRHNVAHNARSNMTVVECLAGPVSASTVSFYRAPASKFGMGSIGRQFDQSPLTLKQLALDDVLDELGLEDVEVVKLDVEGAELGALRGLLRRCRGVGPPSIIFEFCDWAEARIPGQTPGDAQALLLSLGYRLFHLGAKGKLGAAIKHPLSTGSAMIVGLP